jgi:hypothetical protein
MKVLIALILIHSWYPRDCCRDHDCRPVPCDQLRHTSTGWQWIVNGHEIAHFEELTRRDSMDDHCHVCVGNGNLLGRCLFTLPGGEV